MAKDSTPTKDTSKGNTQASLNSNNAASTRKKKRGGWWRIPLRVIGILLLVIILIPVALYIPPVQTAVKDLACSIVGKSTGMHMEIGKFRLKFPLDIQFDDVKIIPSPGDTMVQARSLIADVKLLPLLRMDVKINRLRLQQGRLRILSADSSMDMRIRAGLLEVEGGSSANIRTGTINLHNALLKDGDIRLSMDVWKKKPQPADTTSTPFVINADRLHIDNFRFAMEMLPTIDTLRLTSKKLDIGGACINLATGNIHAKLLSADEGDFAFLTPTPEYVKTHPAPVDTTAQEPSAPMVIAADSIALNSFKVLYAMTGAKPVPGFDPSYISLIGLNVALKNFRNEATDISAPITRLEGRERSGLTITSGSGTFSMDSTGMNLQGLKVRTPFSRLDVSALIPNALMSMEPQAKVDVSADVSVGMPDINAFMPTLRQYTSALAGSPLNAKLRATGELGNVSVPRLDLDIPGILSLRASGKARNVLDIKKLIADLSFDGTLSRPSTVEKLAGPLGFNLPPLRLNGKASANRQTYGADFSLTSPEGDIAGNGSVGITSERYHADLNVRDLNVEAFMKDLGIGYVTASVKAEGAGFNPEVPSARTDIHLLVDEIYYNHQQLKDIRADIALLDGVYTLNLTSNNKALDGVVSGRGTIGKDLYTFDIDADLRQLDLMALGLSETASDGAAILRLKGNASPAAWNYDAHLALQSLDWRMPETRYRLPAITADFFSDAMSTRAHLVSDGTDITFNSPWGLKSLIDSISAATSGLPDQIARRNVDIETLEDKLPPFTLTANASGRGLLSHVLAPGGMSIDTLYAVFRKDSIINGNLNVAKLNTGSMTLDNINLNLAQRERLIDYRIQVTNGPGEMSEFADVNLSGYIGNNRLSAYLNQRNIKGEQGYRIGLTAALADSTVSLHFTPLKATIAYMPWKFNLDNHLDYTLTTHTISANLEASSAESSVLLKTVDSADGNGTDLHLNIKQLKLQDFLKMSVTAPPLTATVNSDIKLHYTGSRLEGNGTLDLSGLSYDRIKMQDLNLLLNAGLDPTGDSRVDASLLAGGTKAMTASALLGVDSVAGIQPRSMELKFDGLPLDLANPFIGVQTASLSGKLKGECDVDITRDNSLRLNGNLRLDSAGVYLPVMATTLRMDNTPIYVSDNIITFDQYDIWACNNNPLTINGAVDATKFSDVKLNMTAAATNFQLVGTKVNKRSEISGKLFMNLDARVKGSLSVMDVTANATVLNTTNVVYTMNDMAAELAANPAEGIVKFVNLQDTTTVAKADSLATSHMAMRISAAVTLQPGMQATVNINSSGSNKAEINPSGTLTYFQNYMGDMKLNGQLYTGEGMVRYNIPVLGTKTFNFEPQSNVVWTGDIMNPRIDIRADDPVKANVSSGGQATLVDFIVSLDISGTLSAPKIMFDLSTDNDMSIQNELQGMTAEQRSTAAMNLLLTGQYTGAGAKNINSNLVTGNLYNFMASTLNSWAANTIKGVNLSFGVNQYETGNVDDTQTNTSYSYQLSKSLFDNRFKIVVGGNYSTDASADENFEQNLISDISFEYTLKQANNYSIIARLFRHTGFESILEGEITETGVGLAYKRRLNNLRSFFRFRRNRRAVSRDTTANVSIPTVAISNDSISSGNPDVEPIKENSDEK